ncbi:N-acetylglucosamine-6-phosphate deacetylase [Edaphobacter bradus]|uniref:N-acetylglucosamine-6-phosphate deacetylase n=1 Tax=Edaphobacter bradus TaxID=2259016 RepID=UPI0021E062DB|nr:N-acetylglucosamine-6-phosphate deacetylase [Edaphobacter bradus]
MLQTLAARRLITSSETIDHPVIQVVDGVITSIHSDPRNGAADTTLTSTFFDVHMHGAASHDVMEGTPKAIGAVSRFLAARGVGHYLATTVTAPVEKTLRSLEGIANAIEADAARGEARPIGIHLEGPFISHAKRGVHPPEDIHPPSIALLDRFHQAARGHIRLMTVAPEIPGSIDMITHAVALGIKVSIGHTNATAHETQPAIDAGATSATHTYNAMRPLDHREPGVLGTVLDTEPLFAELICDGIHVAPELVRLWLKAKGEQRGILITDCMSATGMPDGIYMLGNFKVKLSAGRALSADDLAHGKQTLAGSVLTLDRAVANLQRFAGVPLGTAVRMASHTPAMMVGVTDTVANIAAGQPANFNLFNAAGELTQTILSGSVVPAFTF